MITPNDLGLTEPCAVEQAVAAAKAGNRPLARLHLEQAVKSEPGNADIWLWLAWTADSPAGAISALEQAQKTDPDNRLIPTGLAWARGMHEFDRCHREPFDPQATELEGDNVWLTEAPAEDTVSAQESIGPASSDLLEPESLPAVPLDLPEPQPPIADEQLPSPDEASGPGGESNDQPLYTNQHSCLDEHFSDQVEPPPSLGHDHQTDSRCADDGTDLDSPVPTILAVDDSPTIRKLVSLTLTKHGYNVQTASDGVSALEFIAQCRPSLILMDVKMPRLDGYQLCKLVKKHAKTNTIPVVMLSGKDGVFDKMRGKLVGCDGYITKPFESAELIRIVSEYVPLTVEAR